MDWSSLIKQLTESGLTQSQIAGLVGCGQSAISSMASGATTDPRFSTGSSLLRIARERGIEVPLSQTAEKVGAAPEGALEQRAQEPTDVDERNPARLVAVAVERERRTQDRGRQARGTGARA